MAQETDIVVSSSRSENSAEAAAPKRTRRGAIGKALLVWLGTGSIGLAIVAYLVFRGMGC